MFLALDRVCPRPASLHVLRFDQASFQDEIDDLWFSGLYGEREKCFPRLGCHFVDVLRIVVFCRVGFKEVRDGRDVTVVKGDLESSQTIGVSFFWVGAWK